METAFIKEKIEYFLDKLSVKASLVDVKEITGGDILKFDIKTDEPHLLIGTDGKTMMSLNHLIKKAFKVEVSKGNLKELNFIIDINDHQEKNINDVRNKANMMAERARFFKNDVEMMPMNPYERMLTHSFFTDSEDIKTESTGHGRDRRVVIKYIEIN